MQIVITPPVDLWRLWSSLNWSWLNVLVIHLHEWLWDCKAQLERDRGESGDSYWQLQPWLQLRGITMSTYQLGAVQYLQPHRDQYYRLTSNKDFASSFWPVLLLSNLSWKRNCSKFVKSNKERPQCWPDIHHDRQSWRLLKLQANWYIQQRTDCESYNLSAALL